MHVANVGIKLARRTVEFDFAIEKTMNRDSKMMRPKVSGSADALEACRTVELHMSHQEAFKAQTGLRKEAERELQRETGRTYASNMAIIQALVRKQLFDKAEVMVPHEKPMTVFERKSSATILVTAPQWRHEALMMQQRFIN